MIKKIDSVEKFNSFLNQNIFYVRIMSLAKAYGFGYDFASFYRQIDENRNITAIVSKLDNDFTLCANENADNEELSEFFSVTGYSSVLSDNKFDFKNNYDEGIVMSAENRIEKNVPYVQIDRYPKLMKLFNFIDYDNADFESWYVDISHRIRHNCAKAYALCIDDEIISSGIFSSIYDDGAILSSVQTAPAFRHMGYGSALVSEMLSDIKGKVYLMRENDLNEEFYSKLGFINTGKWRVHK